MTGLAMRGQAGFFDLDERLKELTAKGDALERLGAIVDFELLRPDLARAVPRSDGAKGGRPPFDLVFMFKVLVVQASHSLSDERTEYLIKDRLSFMRFLGLGLADPVPDANTIWTFREALTRARIDGKSAIQVLFDAYEAALTKAGFLAMGGQIIDAALVAAPKQRNSEGEKAEIKAGRIPESWKEKPAKLAQKDRDARWCGEVLQSQAGAGWIKAHRHRRAGLRVQEPPRHRPPPRADPHLAGHRRRPARRGAVAEPGIESQHGERRMGRHGLPHQGQRDPSRRQWAALANPPPEAARATDAD